MARCLFLQDGDALVYPSDKLKEVLQYINQKLPSIERIASYATARDNSQDRQRKARGIRKIEAGNLYIGLESGDKEILQKWTRALAEDEVVEAGKIVKAGRDIELHHCASRNRGRKAVNGHALETARALSEMDPEYVGALTLTNGARNALYRNGKEGRFTQISPLQSLQD